MPDAKFYLLSIFLISIISIIYQVIQLGEYCLASFSAQ